ncbi:MAG: aspartate/glutamate racemase family protein, partial [Eubacterium sp.]|nr:aspartate/glutamate racemase family protein [Candidatus Colimonas fimequi]
MKNAVGVLGGVGPMATVYFMNIIIDMTEASRDQDHINMLVSNHATIPDRTEYIMRRSDDSPLDVMVEDARMLARSGCEFLVIPCNTAHYFYSEIECSVEIPVLNIIEETIKFTKEKLGTAHAPVKKLGIMATEGTITSGTFSHYGAPLGVKTVAPDTAYQKKVNHIIYDCVKAGKPVTEEQMMEVIDHLRAKGCDAVIMGCTELSIAYKDLEIGKKNSDVIDTLEVLARATVLRCG